MKQVASRLSDPEEGSDKFLQNVGSLSTEYMAF
jgi:hypothetical protein